MTEMEDKLAEALRRIADRCPTYSNEYKVASVGDIARQAISLYDAAKAQPKQAAEPAILNCEIQPRPLSHPLADYHRAISEGPLHYTWQDKPHRLVYDLIAAIRFYAAPVAQAEPAWIPVAELMPPPDSRCLVFFSGDCFGIAHTFSKWKHPSHPLGYLISGHAGSHNDVTHWMPLPQPPKEHQ